MLAGLGALAGVRLRLWRTDGPAPALAAGPATSGTPSFPPGGGAVALPEGPGLLAPVPGSDGWWLEAAGPDGARLPPALAGVLPTVAVLLEVEGQRIRVSEELASRYEEIDLLYAITEILGQTVRLEEAALTIVNEVAAVVGARRASIMVYDDATGTLRTVASRGFSRGEDDRVDVRDDASVAARVFRERRILAYDPADPLLDTDAADAKGYRGQAFLSVPICYGAPGSPLRCVGVINLTDRVGGDRFTLGDRKLLAAIASQIGAAIENARLVARDRQQQRLLRELELAHDLQLRLLPSPAVLQGDAQVAARCAPAESVGGDFYTFSRLGEGRVGVMLGDVSSHGFSAALVMALVLSAAGIHVAAAQHPDEVLRALLESVGEELRTTEMYFSVFYGVVDPRAGTLTYASAGHPHAFRLPRDGAPERLGATAPPLGLVLAGHARREVVRWTPGDTLCLWTDGLVDARNADGEAYGEARLLGRLARHATEPPDDLLAAVLADADAWTDRPADDRTLLVLRT